MKSDSNRLNFEWNGVKRKVSEVSGRFAGTKKRNSSDGRESKRKKRKITKMQGVVLTVAVLAGTAALIYFLRARPQPPVYPTVVAEPVVTRDVEIYGEYVGRIRAQQFVEIRARVEGYLEKMLFEEGTYIRKNQTLFIIDPRLYRAKADRARAQLQKDRALALKAQRDLARIRPLYEQNAASQLDLDNAIASSESAAAAVEMSRADLTQAEMELGYTTVRSPISGYISERNVDIGTLVGPGGKSLLATIVKSDTVRVDFSMTGLDYIRSKERNVNLGHRDASRKWDPYITVTLPDNTVYPFRGLVDFADPQVDPQTGTFSVRAEMANPDHILLPGQFTKVKLLLDVREGAIAVPNKAIIIEKGGAYIFVVRPDSMVEKRFIELGPEVGNSTVVERGLAADEKIIVEGYHKLTHGMRVNVVASMEETGIPEEGNKDAAGEKGEKTNEKLYPADFVNVPAGDSLPEGFTEKESGRGCLSKTQTPQKSGPAELAGKSGQPDSHVAGPTVKSAGKENGKGSAGVSGNDLTEEE